VESVAPKPPLEAWKVSHRGLQRLLGLKIKVGKLRFLAQGDTILQDADKVVLKVIRPGSEDATT